MYVYKSFLLFQFFHVTEYKPVKFKRYFLLTQGIFFLKIYLYIILIYRNIDNGFELRRCHKNTLNIYKQIQ